MGDFNKDRLLGRIEVAAQLANQALSQLDIALGDAGMEDLFSEVSHMAGRMIFIRMEAQQKLSLSTREDQSDSQPADALSDELDDVEWVTLHTIADMGDDYRTRFPLSYADLCKRGFLNEPSVIADHTKKNPLYLVTITTKGLAAMKHKQEFDR